MPSTDKNRGDVTYVRKLASLLKVPSANIDGYIRAGLIPAKMKINGYMGWSTLELTSHFEAHPHLWAELIRRVHRSKKNRRSPCDPDRVARAIGSVRLIGATAHSNLDLVQTANELVPSKDVHSPNQWSTAKIEIVVLDVLIKIMKKQRDGYSDRSLRVGKRKGGKLDCQEKGKIRPPSQAENRLENPEDHLA